MPAAMKRDGNLHTIRSGFKYMQDCKHGVLAGFLPRVHQYSFGAGIAGAPTAAAASAFPAQILGRPQHSRHARWTERRGEQGSD